MTTNKSDIKSDKVQIQTYKEAYTFDYPQAIEFAEAQEKVFWTASEIDVDKDIQDMRVNLTPSEYHGVVTTLKLFTLYELVAGNEYWGGRFKRMFPRHDVRQMAATFSYVELGIHAPFYNKINVALQLNDDEFYTDYVKDPVLKARMEYLESIISDSDDLLSIGAFSMVEGAILYSAFAYLKSFQAKGQNKILNVVSGINFSVRDENIHSLAGAWAFKQLLSEKVTKGITVDFEKIKTQLQSVAETLFEHESYIIDMMFSKGDIDHISKDELKTFVKSRLAVCLTQLSFVTEEPKENPVADWFYKDINMIKFGDFFVSVSSEYNRQWREEGFKWLPRI